MKAVVVRGGCSELVSFPLKTEAIHLKIELEYAE